MFHQCISSQVYFLGSSVAFQSVSQKMANHAVELAVKDRMSQPDTSHLRHQVQCRASDSVFVFPLHREARTKNRRHYGLSRLPGDFTNEIFLSLHVGACRYRLCRQGACRDNLGGDGRAHRESLFGLPRLIELGDPEIAVNVVVGEVGHLESGTPHAGLLDSL